MTDKAQEGIKNSLRLFELKYCTGGRRFDDWMPQETEALHNEIYEQGYAAGVAGNDWVKIEDAPEEWKTKPGLIGWNSDYRCPEDVLYSSGYLVDFNGKVAVDITHLRLPIAPPTQKDSQ